MANKYESFSNRSLELEVCDRFLNVVMPGASHPGAIVPVAATGTLTISGSSSGETGDTLVIAGITVALPTLAASDALVAQQVITAVNGSPAAKYVTASLAPATTNVTITANLTPTQNGYQGNSITTVTGSGSLTGISFGAGVLSGGLTGILPYPENKGILAMYQLLAGYYMLVLQDNFKKLLDFTPHFELNSASPPAVDAVWNVVDNVQSRSTGFLLFSSVVNTDAVKIGSITFTCTTAAQASNVTFQVGANDAATAANLAATINGVTAAGVATGFGKVSADLSAVAIPFSGNGGGVLIQSMGGGSSGSVPAIVNWSQTSGSTMTLTPTAALANGPGMVMAFLGAGGSTPTDPAVNTTVKANLKLRRV